MTILEMFQQSAVLTALGMAIVFGFLWIMIICVNFAGTLIHRMGWDKDVLPQDAAPTQAVSPEIAAAISAAVIEHRKKEAACE
ncbi:MAG: OadG family protein [Spirochaetaceae bacterium]|jgi:oxaloacetate decarboxylase gamma subunit|nr:OadG family protein [Spirochaetaceae bacterium]